MTDSMFAILFAPPSKAVSRVPSNVTFSVSARNLLNHTNLGTPIGTLTSPLFGTSNTLAGFGGPGGGGEAGNRRIEFQLRFSF